jgi:mechanosensitive ion channel-like protein
VALVVGVNALEPGSLKTTLTDAVAFLPRILTAILLFALGLGFATLARRSFLLAAVNAGLPWARSGARLTSVFVLAFFGATALDHLGVGRSILVAAFTVIAGGVVLAFALAFGLGARDLARAYLEKRIRAEEEDTGIRHV